MLDWALGTLGILGIGALDYLTGNEMRVFPLYYVPLAILAWSGGRTGAAVATLLCGGSWVARKGFYEEAVRLTALCRRSGRPITAGYIDLDNFKAANDELGHEKGDHVLRSAADALLAAVRPSDVAARVGGDEFIVLLPEVDAQEAVAALERIRASLSEALPQEPVHVSSSIGGVTFTVAPESIDDMVGAADAQMYAAKSQGRDRVALYTFPGRETKSDSITRRKRGPP